MQRTCAWCGKATTPGLRYHDLPETTHEFCEECYLRIRVTETINRLRTSPGPHHLFVPPDREDVVLRIKQEVPPGCELIIHPDHRATERRRPGAGVNGERRARRDRRTPNLTFVAPVPPRA